MKIKMKKKGKWSEPTEKKMKETFELLFNGTQIKAQQLWGLERLGFEIEYQD